VQLQGFLGLIPFGSKSDLKESKLPPPLNPWLNPPSKELESVKTEDDDVRESEVLI